MVDEIFGEEELVPAAGKDAVSINTDPIEEATVEAKPESK